ncbi:MAG TPA: SAM-dependent methyltransferase [Sphingobacteriaceae bacterium]|nr:SAM-dependent methyltransferase [Sphingobacteriaceae bacterium]
MKNVIKKLFLLFLPTSLKRLIIRPYIEEINKLKQVNNYVNLSFSQEGEDLVLSRLLGNKSSGFFIDIGAHHPMRFSNTYKFYLLGWRGINIDPLPGCMKMFNDLRSRDINLEIGISNDLMANLTYYLFNEPALNTFDIDTANKLIKENNQYHLIGKKNIECSRLTDILNKYLSDDTEIDFFNIDVEGMDLEVLKSNDWQKYIPHYIVVESLSTTLDNDFNSPLNQYLSSLNYTFIGKTVNSLFYKYQFF